MNEFMNIFKTLILFVCGSVFFLSSCSGDDDYNETTPNNALIKKTFYVGSATGSESQSRLAMNYKDLYNHSTLEVEWEKTDKVSVFAQGYTVGHQFDFEDWTGDFKNYCSLTGEVENIGNGEKYFLVYPYQPNARLSADNLVSLNLPNVQDAIDGKFDNNACIQVGDASKDSPTVNLKNVCAFIYFDVQNGCNSVEMETVDKPDWHLAGDVTVNPSSSGAKIVGFGANTFSKISLNITNTSGKKSYVIAFIPTTGAANGENSPAIKVRVGYEGKTKKAVKTIASGQAFAAGNFYNLGEFGTPKE